MGNLFKSELYKLRNDRSLWTVILILIVSAIGWAFLQYFDHGSQVKSGFDIYLSAFAGTNYIVKLAPCILAGFFISSEYSNGTMKSIVATGNSRMKIFFTKLMAFSIGAVIISVTFLIVATLTGITLFGGLGIPEEFGYGYLVQTIGLLILYAVAFAAIMALFGIILTDSGKSIGFLILFFLTFDSLFFLLASKVSLFELAFNYSVFKLFLEIAQPNIGAGELVKMTFIPILTFIGFGILGSLIFNKKEIK